MLKGNIEKVEAALPGDRAEVEAMRKQLESYKAELGTPLEGGLSAADSRTVQEIEARIPQINKELKSATDKLSKKKSERCARLVSLCVFRVCVCVGVLGPRTPLRGRLVTPLRGRLVLPALL
jgi:septal ring factor EnvC (AmiA/AmiB activator)